MLNVLQVLSVCLVRTVRLLAVIRWKSMGLSFSHMYYIFKYYCTCKNGAHLVCYYSFITSFWSFLLCAASQILLHCCFPRSVFQYHFSYLYTKMHYWDSSSDVPFFLLCSLCFSPIPLLHFASFFISLSLIYLPFCFLFRCQLCLCPFTPPVLQGFLINSEVHITEVFIWLFSEGQLHK